MRFDPLQECSREMLLRTEPILRSSDSDFVYDEVDILCNFINSDDEIRLRFAAWLETYVNRYIEEIK